MGAMKKSDKDLIEAIRKTDGKKMKEGMIRVFTHEVIISSEDAKRVRDLRGYLTSMLQEAEA